MFSQQYYFETHSVKDGLPHSSVYSVIQDSLGFLWVGNKAGVSRFDGHSFVSYSSKDGLAEGAVWRMLMDKSGFLWLGHEGGGVSRYKNGIFEVLNVPSLISRGDVLSICEYTDGSLWIGFAYGGVVRIHNPGASIDELKISEYKGKEGLSDAVFLIFLANDNRLFFVLPEGIKYYIPGNDVFQFYDVVGLPKYFSVTSALEDSKKNLWLGTYNGGLYKYDKKKSSFVFYDISDGLAHNFISSVYEDDKGNIWVGTWGGGISSIQNDKIKTFNPDNGFPDIKVRSISGDREGNVIFCTYENGFVVYKGDQFISYGKKDGLMNEQIWSVIQDKNGMIWMGTGDGIATLNWPHDELKTTVDRNAALKGQVVGVREDNTGNIWVATKDQGLYKFDKANRKFILNIPVFNYLDPQFGREITCLETDVNGNVWVGTPSGIIRLDIKNNIAKRISNENGLAGNNISVLFADTAGVLWVGIRNKGISRLYRDKIDKVELGVSYTPVCMSIDNEGWIWIGTEAHGILISDGKRIIKHIGIDEGLLSELVTFIEIDNNNIAWIGSGNGLVKFSKINGNVIVYGEKDGFTGMEVKINSSMKDRNGDIWMGTVHGIYRNSIESEKKNIAPPLIHISQFIVNLKELNVNSIPSLNYLENSIGISYKAMCLTNPDAVEYQVMMEGVDGEWKHPTKQVVMEYPLLPPGEYIFKVRAKNNSGVWAPIPASIAFVIFPPFWKRWWFYALCFMGCTVTLYAYIKIREKKLVKQNQLLEDKVKERTREVNHKNAQLDMINKEITASIRYAKRIQDAILPSYEIMESIMPDHFVFYKPKDIVSGDFYWASKLGNKVLFSAVDCTGHGVPGAFMSIVGHNLLEQIVVQQNETCPSLILERMDKGVSDTLRQTLYDEPGVKDGMDMALCSLDIKTGELQYAGAYNPMWLVRNGKAMEFSANKFPIGNLKKGESRSFENTSVMLEKGDVVYIFSDGFADQFGGEKGKKLKYKPFRSILENFGDISMRDRKIELEKKLNEWMGGYEQVDDILVIGVRW